MQFRDKRKTCIIVACGPSAGELDAELIRDWPVIVVNDAWRLVPLASCLYAADGRWWKIHIDAVRANCTGELWTQDAPAAKAHGLRHVQGERTEGLSRSPGVIRNGGQLGNSGAQAINLAYLFGARRLILVGFDMRWSDGTASGDRGGKEHFFGKHPKGLNNGSCYAAFVRGMGRMAADLHMDGIEVINTSQHSALPYWPKRTLSEVILQISDARVPTDP